MNIKPVSFQRGMRVIRNNRFSPLSYQQIDEKSYARSPVMKRGKGPYLYDYDDNRFIDFDLQNGALVHGHAPPRLTSVIKAWLGRGFSHGFPSAAHRPLSRTMHDVLYTESNLELKLLYLDSEFEAVCVLPQLLSGAVRGGGGVYISNWKKPHGIEYTPLYCHNLQTSSFEDVKNLNAERIDYAILRIDETVDLEMVRGGSEWLRNNDIPCIGDAATISSFLHMKRLVDWHSQFDAVLYGNWLASGLPFSAIAVHNVSLMKVHSGSRNMSTTSIAARIETGTSSLYKLKAAQRSLHLFRKNGAFNQLTNKHTRFFATLNKKHFQLLDGLVYLRDKDQLRNAYDDLRVHLLRAGFIFPHTYAHPVSLSFAHSDELLKKCAVNINEAMHLFYQPISRS